MICLNDAGQKLVAKYSPKAAKALAYLKRPYNDIDIFVEDTGNRTMWVRVLKRLLPATVRLSSVNMLGGKEQVVQACKLDQRDDGRQKLYIVDGDFDFLLAQPKPRLRYLYRLRAYCIENLLLNETALIDVGTECRPTLDEAAVSALIELDARNQSYAKQLAPLFIIYATARELAPAVATVGVSVHNLLANSKDCPELDGTKIFRRMLSVAKAVRAVVGLRRFREVRREISVNARSLPLEMVVSGKNYILPLVYIVLRKKLGYVGSLEQLKARLANEFSPQSDRWLAYRIAKLAS